MIDKITKMYKPVSLTWVSEWFLFHVNSEIFQLYHDENKLIFNEMIMGSALY